MGSGSINTDAIRGLIKAVRDYREEIYVNKRFLLNAANVCDQVMGSDSISKRKIARLSEALFVLDQATEAIIEEAIELLERDVEDLERIAEEA
ncbi:MAG: hypothetical protein U0M72_02920 [Eggerthellaceae bacterium]